MKTSTTADRLRELLTYEPETGVFAWRQSRGRAARGKVAGQVTRHGYISISVDGINYQAHRLAWLYENGEWPEKFLDHIDGDRANNRIKNLRQATNAENLQNRKAPAAHNKCGLLGVSKRSGRWRAQIVVDGVAKHLGVFNTPEAAHQAYLSAKREMHPLNTI